MVVPTPPVFTNAFHLWQRWPTRNVGAKLRARVAQLEMLDIVGHFDDAPAERLGAACGQFREKQTGDECLGRTVSLSMTLILRFGFKAEKYAAASLTSASIVIPLADAVISAIDDLCGPENLRAPLFMSAICWMK